MDNQSQPVSISARTLPLYALAIGAAFAKIRGAPATVQSAWSLLQERPEVLVSAMQPPTTETRGVRCPQCGRRIPPAKLIFRGDFQCIGCQVPLHVSVAYPRVLVLLSIFTSLAVWWIFGIRDLRLFLFYLPLGFLILTVIARVALFAVPPRLYVGKPPSVITKLDLSP